MNPYLITCGMITIGFGLVVMIAGFDRAEAESKPKEQAMEPPKSGDYRIVRNPDGTFTVERYETYPNWHSVGTGNSWGTLDRAKRLLDALESRPQVVK